MIERKVKLTVSLNLDGSMCYQRIINEVIQNLPDDYEFFEDIFDVQKIMEQIDYELRKNN